MSNTIELEARGNDKQESLRQAAHARQPHGLLLPSTADQQAVMEPWWARLIRLVPWRSDGPGLAPHPDDAVWASLQNYPYGPPQR
jgi:hypothetical protein